MKKKLKKAMKSKVTSKAKKAVQKKVEAIPKGYHTVTPYLIVQGAATLLDFMKQAFGAVVLDRMDAPDGSVAHASARVGGSMVMLGEAKGQWKEMPATIHLYVKDVDATYQRALQAGATSVMEPANQFWGDRHGGVKDACGNHWLISTHVENVSRAEMKKRSAAWMQQNAACVPPTS